MILHSNIFGEGKPLVILHGFLGMGDNWKTLGTKFAESGHEVHLVDQRNHGRSFHSNSFSYSLMVADLYYYCEHHGLDEILLLGHSMGGKVAMLFAVTHPDRVEKLVVADIAPKFYPLHHQIILKALAALDASDLKRRGDAEKIISKYIEHIPTRLFLLKNLYWKQKGELGLRINLEVLTRTIDEVGKALPDDTTYEGDTLFLRGSESNYIENEDKVLINRHFPNSQIMTVSRAGHWLHAENPQEFHKYVANFL